MGRVDSLEKTLMLGGIECRRSRGRAEDEMAGWHLQLNGHGFGWTLGVGDGQGSLACCSPWGHKELDLAEQLKNSNNAVGWAPSVYGWGNWSTKKWRGPVSHSKCEKGSEPELSGSIVWESCVRYIIVGKQPASVWVSSINSEELLYLLSLQH